MRRFSRGQEEAPIELLIAVTILTFVLIIGLYTYQNLCSSQFEQKLKTTVSIFARNIEAAYQGGIGTSFQVTLDLTQPPECSGKINDVRLTSASEDTCNRIFGRQDCLQLIAVARDPQGGYTYPVIEYMNIPLSVQVAYYDTVSLCDSNLQDNQVSDYDAGNTLENCSWKPTIYRLTITKETASSIKITRGA